jgi:peptidoglycan/LPS O-acetylase OafA/YrhL
MEIARSGRFEEIDVLRGLAAMCVVLSHYLSYCSRYLGYGGFDFQNYGFYAVELFFIISGFVIYWSLEKSGNWRDFALSRVTRLYPTYLVALIVMAVAETLVFHDRIAPTGPEKVWLPGAIANTSMLQEFLGFSDLDHVYWTLTVEIAFYVDVAVLSVLGLLGRVELVAGLWLALACVWSFFAQPDPFTPEDPWSRYLILSYVPFFVAGITFYLIHAKGATKPRIGIILGALAAEWWMHGAARLGVAVLLFAVFGLVLTGRLRFLASPVAVWFGTISYPLYLIHRNLGYSTLLWLDEKGIPIWLAVGLAIAGALALASLLCYLVERPALRFLRRLYRSAAPALAPMV